MIRTIMTNELEQILRKESVQLVDVREKDETDAGHIENAILMPLGNIKKTMKDLDQEKEVYVICHSGGRSLRAAKILSKKGFNVVNVLGGMSLYRGKRV